MSTKNDEFLGKIEKAVEKIRMGAVALTYQMIQLEEKTGIDMFPAMLEYIQDQRDSR